MTVVIQAFIGLILLAMGRKLFWLFVGVVGFRLGMAVAGQFVSPEMETALLVIGLIVGIGGALAAVFLQRLALGLAGFLVGAFFAAGLLEQFGLEISALWLILITSAGLVGVALTSLVFGWALTVLTALTGAFLVLEALPVEAAGLLIVLFLFLFLAGVAMQFGLLHTLRIR
jgi:hypothetical protein